MNAWPSGMSENDLDPRKDNSILPSSESISAEQLIRETTASIPALNPAWQKRAISRLNSLTKPVGSLGRLEQIATRLVAIREEEFPDCSNKATLPLLPVMVLPRRV